MTSTTALARADAGPTANVLAFPGHDRTIDVAVPTNPRGSITAGFAIIALAFGGLGGWAALAPLDSAVVAHGVLAVESKRKAVQHLEGGIVKEILAHDGDLVAAGAPLLRLDDTRAQANLATVEAKLAEALALQARLQAERDGSSTIAFPPALAERGDAVARAAMAGQRSEFAERGKSLANQISILERQIAQLGTEIDSNRRQQAAKRSQMASLRAETAGLAELVAKGYYPRNKTRAMEREQARLDGEIGADEAAIAHSEQGIAQARLQIAQTEQRFREEVVARLRDTQREVNELNEQAVALRDVFQRLMVTAPAAGMVQNSKVATIGGVVPAGAELMEVVPSGDRLVVEARIPPENRDGLHPGLVAEVRFSGLHARETPVIMGEVAAVSADRITDPRDNQSFYAARVEVAPEELAKLADHRLQAGMPAELVIKTGERTVLDYLVKPLFDTLAVSLREK